MKSFVRLMCILLFICTLFVSCGEVDDIVSDVVNNSGEATTLPAPSLVWIEDGFLCWNPVEYATRYTVKIDGKESFCDDVKLSLAGVSDGDHTFAVKANGDGTNYASSSFTEVLSVKLTGGAITQIGAYSQFDDLSESYLGYGFDVIRSSVFSDKYVKLSAPIFTAEGIKSQRLLRVDSKSSHVNEIVSSSMDEFSEQWNASANIGVSWGKKKIGGSVELSAKYSNDNSKTKSLSYQVVSITNQQFYIVMQSDLATYRSIMTDSFKADLYSDMSPATFFDRYGTHFITSAVMGGKINSYYKHSSETEQSLTQASAQASIEVRAFPTQVNVDVSVDWRQQMASQGIEVVNTIEVLGGGDFGMLSATDVPKNYAAWEKSLDSNPSLIGIKDTGSLWGVWELIDPSLDTAEIYTWIDENGDEQHGTRSAQLQAYFYQYGVESYNNLMEAASLPEMIEPTEIVNIRVNGAQAQGGEYIVYAGVENDISFTVLPQEAVGYTKSIAISGVCDYASVNEHNQLVVHANAPANGLITVVLSAGGVRQQIQVRVRQTYMVEFQPSYPEEGDWDPIAPKTNVQYNNTITKPIVQNVPGYIFLGWYVNGDMDQPWNFLQDRVKGNMVLIGAWAEYNPTITFVDNYNTNSIASIKIPYNTALTRPVDPVLAGYSFGGFYSGSDMVREFDFTKKITTDTVIYVKWIPDVTVRFHSSVLGWSKDAVTIPYNTKLSEPAEPVLSGYSFGGWFADSSFSSGSKFDFSKPLLEDQKVYVLWYRNPTVSFYSSVDGFYKESQEVPYGDTLAMPNVPVLSGYTFGGFYSSSDMVCEFDFTKKITTDTVIYVKWIPDVTVWFYSSVSGWSKDAVTIPYNTKLSVPAEPVLSGYKFGGWFADSSFSSGSEFDFSKPLTEDVSVYVLWHRNPTVSFYSSVDDFYKESQQVPYGDTLATPVMPVLSGYRFGGWFADASCETEFNFSQKIIADTIIYVKWNKNPTVSFSSAIAGFTMESVRVPYDTCLEAVSDPVLAHYNFAGWYVDAACTTLFDFAQKVTHNITLYAKFNPVASSTPKRMFIF